MVRGEDGVTRAAIDWGWFKEYRDILVARVAAGKKVTPEIYQMYLNPTEKLLTLWPRIPTAGRPAGEYGRIICTTFSPHSPSAR